MARVKTGMPAVICAAAIALAANARGQNGGGTGSPRGLNSPPASSSYNDNDRALEIVPRSNPSTPAAQESPEPDQGILGQPSEPEAPAVPTSGPPAAELGNGVARTSPYLGISVQRIESHVTPGHDVEGLEVVSVDPGSPAEQAGLRGRGGLTKWGATGATAGALMPPLNLVVMPLLNKTGQLGQTGDLIVEIDDQRVASEMDLRTALDKTKPGDTMYFTVQRLETKGGHTTLKIPVKLGQAK